MFHAMKMLLHNAKQYDASKMKNDISIKSIALLIHCLLVLTAQKA